MIKDADDGVDQNLRKGMAKILQYSLPTVSSPSDKTVAFVIGLREKKHEDKSAVSKKERENELPKLGDKGLCQMRLRCSIHLEPVLPSSVMVAVFCCGKAFC